LYEELALLSFYICIHCHSFSCYSSRSGIIITNFHGFGTNCMVPSDWDSAPRCVCGSNFISDLIGESPIFPGAESRNVQLRFKPRSFILCNYYATMEVSSSDEELTHQPVVKWLSNPRQPIETPAVPRSEETTKTMMQGLGTESALLRQRSCDARACRIYACTGFHQTVHSTSSSNLYDTHTSCLPV